MPLVLHLAKDPPKNPSCRTSLPGPTKRQKWHLGHWPKSGITQSKLLDELIASAISAKPVAQIEDDQEPVEPTAEGIESARINVRLPTFLLDGAKKRAVSKAMSTNRWVVALLQTHLTEKPVMTDYQIAILRESNREMAAIGRNLNQIAHSLNESFHETDRVKMLLLFDLSAELKANVQAYRNLFKASLQAWSFKVRQKA